MYARFGVPEFWLVDPERKTVEVFALEGRPEERGEVRYRTVGVFVPGIPLRSLVMPGFECDPAEVFH